MAESNPLIENIHRFLGRRDVGLSGRRPDIYPPRNSGSVDSEIEQFLREIKDLQAIGERLLPDGIQGALIELVARRRVRKATMWDTPLLQELDFGKQLRALGVELVHPNAEKYKLAECDLGITEADFLLPETGTVGLGSSAKKPRAVSLLPITHLVVASAEAVRPDLHQVFAEASRDPYLVLITGASRTADIEMTPTLGVHGPKYLYVWIIDK